MAWNKGSLGRWLVGSLIVGSSPGKLGLYTVSPAEVTRFTRYTSGTITPGGILTQTVYTTTVTATGVAVGDVVDVIPPAAIATGLAWNAYVSAANTITLRVVNETASTITPTAAAWSFFVIALSPGNV